MTQPTLVLTIRVNTFHFLAYSPSFKGNGLIPVGHFADISATIADNFDVETAMIGESFLNKLV